MTGGPSPIGAALKVTGVVKRFGRSAALEGADVEVREGEILALLGPSGSGKTTLLRIIAGLEQPDEGAVTFQGRDLLAIPPRHRKIGMVCQHYALFRNMTAAQNVAFGLKARLRAERPSGRDIKTRVQTLLDRVQLGELAKRFPAQLSGGQRQRVALARALAIEPDLLLLDEPFGALDAKVRLELRRWVRQLQGELNLTTVFVTHDQEEALELADRVAVMRAGKVVQTGSPSELYAEPAEPFVFEFLGGCVRLPVTLTPGGGAFGGWASERVGASGATSGEASAYVRPEAVEVSREGPGLAAIVAEARPVGARTRLLVRIDQADAPVELAVDGVSDLISGDAVFLRPRRFQVF
ncbi:sulfate/molybdate ABC transporter ATP-binding protein [soil metagenome]